MAQAGRLGAVTIATNMAGRGTDIQLGGNVSMRRASCRSVPTMCSPPSSRTPSPSLMSVPRPAMLVAIVTAPRWPAC